MKASKWLSENVIYVDPEGVEIDNALLRADQSVESDDADADPRKRRRHRRSLRT